MAEAIYKLAREEISDIVNSPEELMKQFKHGLPKGTEIYGYDPIIVNKLEIPRIIRLRSKKPLDLPKTKIDGLYELAVNHFHLTI